MYFLMAFPSGREWAKISENRRKFEFKNDQIFQGKYDGNLFLVRIFLSIIN